MYWCESGFIRAKEDVFGKILLYSGKVVVFWEEVIVFGQSGFIRANVVVFGKM